MKSLHKIANTFLAVCLLIATTGFTLNKHYCMGRLKAVAINESANLCSEKESQEPMPCCEDISQHLKVEEITKASFDFDSQPDLVELAIVSWILSDFVSIHDEDGNPQFQYYSPPPPGINYQVDYQVYLI